MQKARFLLRHSLTSHELASAKVLLFFDTGKFISIIVRKLSVFIDFAGSLIHSNFAVENREDALVRQMKTSFLCAHLIASLQTK